MENCLVTKLKGIVNNDNLEKLNVFKLYGLNNGETNKQIQLSNDGTVWKATVVSGTSPWGVESSKEFTDNIGINSGEYVLEVTPMYKINVLNIYGSVGINLKQVISHINKDNLEALVINVYESFIGDTVPVSAIASVNMNTFRCNNSTSKFSGLVEDFSPCLKITEISCPAGIQGSLTNLANAMYANRDYTQYPTISFKTKDAHVTYYNGTTDVAVTRNTTYFIVFKQGGYEIHLNTADGTLLYDSLA